jgi:hypothetical protein
MGIELDHQSFAAEFFEYGENAEMVSSQPDQELLGLQGLPGCVPASFAPILQLRHRLEGKLVYLDISAQAIGTTRAAFLLGVIENLSNGITQELRTSACTRATKLIERKNSYVAGHTK